MPLPILPLWSDGKRNTKPFLLLYSPLKGDALFEPAKEGFWVLVLKQRNVCFGAETAVESAQYYISMSVFQTHEMKNYHVQYMMLV